MPAPVPVLDDRTFDDLVLEARSLIPRVLPEWTDLNPSDPAVTLLELFAYLIDTLFFQVDQIEDRTLGRFATLLGAPPPAPGADAGTGALQRLRQAVTARALPSRAVTSDDAVALLRHGLRRLAAPLTGAHPSGAPVVGHATVTGLAALAEPAAGDELSLTAAGGVPGPPVILAGDLLVVTDPDQAEVVRVASVEATGASAAVRVGLAEPLRFPHPAGVRVDRVTGPVPAAVTTLAAGAAAGAAVVRLVPEPALPLGGVLLIGGEYVPATAVSRAAVVALDRPADDGRVDRLLSAQLVAGDGRSPASEDLLQAGYDLLRSLVPLGSRLEVASPPVLALPLEVTVVRDAAALLRADEVRRAVLAAIVAYLDPLTGGREGTGWPFGGLVYRSELYRVVEAVPGVDHVSGLLLDGDPAADQWPPDSGTGTTSGTQPTWLVELASARITVRDR